MFSVYILECGDGTLYIGITTELAARLDWHKAGHGSAYTARRLPLAVVHFEEYQDIHDAIARERQLKRWSAQKSVR